MSALLIPGQSRLKRLGPARAESAPPTSAPAPPSALPSAHSGVPAELTRRLSESFGSMSPWGWPLLWQAYQNSTYPGPGGFPYRGASGTTNDRAYGKDIPFFWSEVDLRGYRVTSRYLAETNPFAIGFMNLLQGYHVRKGFGWQACRKGAKKTPYPTQATDDALVQKAQKILDDFRDRNLWPVLSRECFYRWRVDGETFLRIDWSREDGIWARVIEPEQVGSPDGSTTDPWSYGIDVLELPSGATDPLTVLAYHVWDLDSGMTAGEWVDSKYVVHAKANVVLNVKRGRPDFFPVLDLFDGVRKLYTNMLTTAVDQAAVTWLERFPSATGDQIRQLVPQQSIGNGQTVPADQSCGTWGMGWPGSPWWMQSGQGGNRFRPGTIIRTEGNRQFDPGPVSQTAGFESVEKLAMRAARMRWNLPGSASGDAEDTTFAAAIQAGGPFPVAVEGGQTHWGACFERPCALKVLDRAVTAGLLTPAERAALDVETTEPQVVSPEPDKDTQRYKTEHDAGVRSATSWQLAVGLDPQHETANFEAEKKRAGVQPQQPGGGTPPGGAPLANAPPAGGGAGDIFGEHVFREGFTGTVTDKNGHQLHYVDGKRVAKAPEPAAAPPAGAAQDPAAASAQLGHARRQKDAAAAEHFLATAQERPRSKASAAADQYKDVARRRRVLAGVKNEGELATAIDGHNNPDSEPADVTHLLDANGQPVKDARGVKDALLRREAAVLTLQTGRLHRLPRTEGQGAVIDTGQPADEHAKAFAGQVLAEPAEFFEVKTLLTSAKDGVYMNPKALARKRLWAKKYAVSFHVVAVDNRRGQKHSGHSVYVAPAVDLSKGQGAVKLDAMKKVEGFADVLKAVRA